MYAYSDLARAQQLVQRAAREVDRDREADALVRAGRALDLRVDADHASAGVEERAAGVAAIDLRVGLDRVRDGEPARREGVDRAPRRRDHADGQGALLAEGASDRGDRLADDDLRGVPERHGLQAVVGGPDADHSDVAEEVPSDHAAADPLAVRELDVHRLGTLDVRPRLRGVRDDVRVREDHAVAVDDEARALRRAVDSQIRVDGDDTWRPGGVDRLRVECRAG